MRAVAQSGVSESVVERAESHVLVRSMVMKTKVELLGLGIGPAKSM